VLTRGRHLLGVALIASCIAVSSAVGGGAASAAVTTTVKSSSSAFCQAYNNLSSYKGNTSTISGFRSSLHHLRTLVQQVQKTAPPSVKAHLTAFLKDEAQLQSLADKSSSFNALSSNAQAQAVSTRLQSDGSPVDSYAGSHCKG
jgi:uncharacterized surface protein with fasciclin (FAS1) repeats